MREEFQTRFPSDDVTLRHPCAIKYVAQAALGDGAAARAAEAAKRDRYPVLAAAGLDAAIPFALETFGRLGPAGLRLLRQARQSAAESRLQDLGGRPGNAEVALAAELLASGPCMSLLALAGGRRDPCHLIQLG